MKNLLFVRRRNPSGRVVVTHPVEYLGHRWRYVELHLPGGKGPAQRIPVDADDRAAVAQAKARLLQEANLPHRQNPLGKAFPDSHGVLHPVRGSKGYDESVVKKRAEERKRLGLTSADQQLERSFERWTRREEDKKAGEQARAKIREREQRSLDERLYRLTSEREALAEHLQGDSAARYTGLIRARGEMRGEVGLIPWEQARKAGLDPSRLKRNAIHKDRFGRRFVRWEYGLDTLATEAGYRDGDHFKAAIERAAKQKDRLAALDNAIRATEREARRAMPHKRNPGFIFDALALAGAADLAQRLIRHLTRRRRKEQTE